MNRYALAGWTHRVTCLAAILLFAFSSGGCNKLKARDLLNKGVQAYKSGLYDEAIKDFQQAIEADPGFLNARLYLARSYASQYIPGAPSDENIRKGNQAIAESLEVLKVDPKNVGAIDQIGWILYNMAGSPYSPEKFEESKKYNLQHIVIKQDDPEPYYWVGVIDWSLAYRSNQELRHAYNAANPRKQVREEEALPQKVRSEFTAKNQERVEEGIARLKSALTLRNDYEDAMAYLNLLYRQKADMVESAAERESLLKQADDLMEQRKEIKQKKMNQPQKS